MRSFYSSSLFHQCYCDPRGRSSIHRKRTLTGIDGAHTDITATPSQEEGKRLRPSVSLPGIETKGLGQCARQQIPWKFGGALDGTRSPGFPRETKTLTDCTSRNRDGPRIAGGLLLGITHIDCSGTAGSAKLGVARSV